MAQGEHTEQERPEGVGMTALIVAQARATESLRPDRLFDDPFAADFVAAASAAHAAPAEDIALPTASKEIVDISALRGDTFAIRTRFFDDYVLEACASGCHQVVLLGAGLDTRAFRLAWPVGVRLFELDLPDVLAFKDRVLAGRSITPTCQRIVVRVDLRQDWPAALIAAGFQTNRPAAWLPEGILMYLTEEERDRLLDRIGDLSAPASRLALDQTGAATPQSPGVRSFHEAAGQSVYAHLKTLGRADPSMVDLAAWLTGHGWRAHVYSSAERFVFYGRPVPALLEAGVVQGWLASAERSLA